MLYTIKNASISLTVDSLGAQMMHMLDSDGNEYLWQGDPTYWKSRAPVLFPFIGRLTDGQYTVSGMPYTMGIHGFARHQEFSVYEHTDDVLVLVLEDREETRAQYPFAFSFFVKYKLVNATVQVTYAVYNKSDKTMPFAVGGHPGFRVPLTDEESFEDYTLVFSEPCQPVRIGFSEKVLCSGMDTPYTLKDGKLLALRHDLFDDDAIILKDMAKTVTLQSKKTGRGVCVSYPDMTYLGFWHSPKTDAPYVCIEPWSSLPARHDVIEEFTTKEDMLQLPPMEHYENTWTITLL